MKQEVKKYLNTNDNSDNKKYHRHIHYKKNTDILYALCIHLFFLSACFQTKQQQQQQQKMRHLVC